MLLTSKNGYDILINCIFFNSPFSLHKLKITLNFTVITLQIKKTALKTLLIILEIFIYIGRGFEYLFMRIIFTPFKIASLFVFRYLGIPAYRIYRFIKKWLTKIFAPAKNKIIYPLLNKSTIHIALIFIGLAVIANNFFIKETKAEEFAQDTILASVFTNAQDIEIVETAIHDTGASYDYLRTAGVLRIYDAPNTDNQLAVGEGGEKNEIMTTAANAALVKPGLAQTTTGDRPRESVIYYQVEPGDTVSTIAEKFNVSTNTILWENKLGPKDYIKPGDKLTILPLSGVSHQVASGETLEKIASKYEANLDEIMDYNQLADSSAIQEDQILIIPGGIEPAPKPTIQPSSSSSSGFALFNIPPPSSASTSATLLWPTTSRKISQYYKWGHLAIDIAGNYSSPVYAADSGRVEAVGWGTGYGNRIIINHGNGIKTLYAHHSKMFVSTGDYVERGQTIGMIGCTGWCTGPHVHFEVIVNGSKANPLNYL